jgi:hypothetical protein
MKKPILIIVSISIFLVVILLTGLWLNANSGIDAQQGFFDFKSGSDNVLPMIFSGIAMLAGIIFGCFYNRFTELQKQNVTQAELGREAKAIFTSVSFYLALSASPIVFGVIIIASKGISLLPSVLLAFQNGFFWQNVMPKNFGQTQKPTSAIEPTPKPTGSV